MNDNSGKVKQIANSVEEFKINKNQKAFDFLLEAFNPLVLKYARKLYFMEQEDAVQELNISIFEAICNIKFIENEYACFSYIQNSIYHCYCKLCSANREREEYLEQSEIIDKNETAFLDCIFLYDLFASKLSYKEKLILFLLFYGLTDSEIVLRVGTSRQYVNRIKKTLLNKV